MPRRGFRRATVRAGGAALIAAAFAFAPSPVRAADDPGCGVSAVVQQSGAVVYRLPHAFIRLGSDSLWTRVATWRRGADYGLDPTRGELRLLREPAPGETLWVSVCWLVVAPPLDLRLNIYHPAPGVVPDTNAAAAPAPPPPRPVTGRSPTTAAAGTELAVTGNKTIAVDFGSGQDAFLRQSLDLAVSGTLAPGVEMTGALSDRNTPLGAAGATQSLQSLDRVLIELKAPSGRAALGDVTLALDRGEFGRVERRLQGVRGEWNAKGFSGVLAAASEQGEYNTLQFVGIEGRQGPYELTDRSSATGVSVVAGSEVVTMDGVRLTRGESADYSIDYDRGRVTFTNRRPVTSASRITIDYQFTLNRFRRNMAAAGASWERGAFRASSTFITESDDGGSPLGFTFDASDRYALSAAGDSASRAIGPGVAPGPGDYTFIPAGAQPAHYAFAGVDSGAFVVGFARVAQGQGAYQDSAVVAGHTAYRFVGQGNGDFQIGRQLPLPESHQLWSVGGSAAAGPVTVDLEGAVSRHDRNTLSSLDDGDNSGIAGRARVALAGAPRWLGGAAGLELTARGVDRRFDPFSRVERAFAEEDWGLPIGADLDHQQRIELTGFATPRAGGELRASLGHLATPDGFRAFRRAASWTRDGTVSARASWQRSDGTQPGLRFASGGRERATGELAWRTPWLEPALRGEWDRRSSPSDTGTVGARTREIAAEVRSPRAIAWRALLGYAVRHEGLATAGGFVDQDRARTLHGTLETPAAQPWGASLAWQRRLVDPLANPARTRSDLASARLRAGDPGRGWSGLANLEITSEGENRQVRRLVFVGAGKGPYDAAGNLVGNGDYDLVSVLAPDLQRIARAATSARATWRFGASDVWRGSRVEFDFESEARRRGELGGRDAVISPGAALGDTALARGAVTQRFETELAPGSRVSALRFRIERRVSADRGFTNFAQTQDAREATLTWRARATATVSAEVEGRWKRSEAGQTLGAGVPFRRTLGETGAIGQLVFTPDARVRAAASVDAGWVRPESPGGATGEATRTIKVGPDLGVAVGARGHVDLTVRRAFISGAPPIALVPGIDPAGAPRWDGTVRGDYRVHESTTFSTSVTVRDRSGQPLGLARPTEVTGRAELRAFF